MPDFWTVNRAFWEAPCVPQRASRAGLSLPGPATSIVHLSRLLFLSLTIFGPPLLEFCLLLLLVLVCFAFETRICSVTQAGLELPTFLSLFPECWDYRMQLVPCPALCLWGHFWWWCGISLINVFPPKSFLNLILEETMTRVHMVIKQQSQVCLQCLFVLLSVKDKSKNNNLDWSIWDLQDLGTPVL